MATYTMKMMKVSQIKVNEQVRKSFDDRDLRRSGESMRQKQLQLVLGQMNQQPEPGPTRECLETRLRPLFLWLRKRGFDEDVAWAAVARAWCKAIAYLEDGRAFSLTCRLTWLHEVAYFAALDEVACQKKMLRFDPDAVDLMPHAKPPEANEALDRRVRDAVERLPKRQREAVECVFMRGMTVRGAAKELGIAEASLRGRLKTARKNLAAILGDIVRAPESAEKTLFDRALAN
jgi:RNA polymerase sigma factor (sigma-70 family)